MHPGGTERQRGESRKHPESTEKFVKNIQIEEKNLLSN